MKIIHKLLLIFFCIALLILFVGHYSIRTNRKILEESITQNTLQITSEILSKIEINIQRRIEIFQEYSHDHLLQEAVKKSNQEFEKLGNIQEFINTQDREWTSTSKETITPFMESLMNNRIAREIKDKIRFYKNKYGYPLFAEIILTNKFGANVAMTGKTSDFRQDDEEWWRKSKEDNVFIKDIEYDESSDVYSIDLGIRIDDEKGNFIGVLKIIYNIDEVINDLKKMSKNNLFSRFTNEKIILITREGKAIYSSGKHKFFDDATDLLPLSKLRDSLDEAVIKPTYRANALIIHNHSKGYKDFKGLNWSLVVEYDVDEIFAPIKEFNEDVLINTLLMAFLASMLGLVVSKNITSTISKLKHATKDISKGEFATKIGIKSNDEIGELADSFEKMAQDLQKSREKILKSKEFTDNIISSMINTLVVLSPDGIIQTVNQTICSLLGYQRKELVGQNASMFFCKDLSSGGMDIQEIIEKGFIYNREKIYLTKVGRKIHVLFSGSALKNSKGEVQGIVCIAQDLTEHKKAEEALKESENQLRLITQNIPAMVAYVDQAQIFRFANHKYCETFKRSPNEIIGRTLREIIGEKAYEAIQTHIEKVLSGQQIDFEAFLPFEDGKWRFRHVVYVPHFKEKEVVGFFSLVQDITDRKRLDAQLRQFQKMESIGTLAGGIAHDFNNILTSIIGYTELNIEKFPSNSKTYADLRHVLDSGFRARDLVKQILTFSRQTKEEFINIQLSQAIKEALKLIRSTIPSTIEIRQNLDENSGTIKGDLTQIHQMIMNLCINAEHAMRKRGGVLEVNVESVHVDVDFANKHTYLKEGAYAKLTISDTGHGMNQATMERIFDPFFTTKGVGEGTGMGLATVHGIVLSHDGEIIVQSELEKGTTFHIYLPKSEDIETQKKPQSKAIIGGNERILFVDDEEGIVGYVKRLLESLGYEVVAKTNSLEALETFRKNPQKFDLVITDQAMLNMTGHVLAKELMQIRPEIPVILCTGYSHTITAEKAIAIGIREFLMKPFIDGDLARTVRRILDQNKNK